MNETLKRLLATLAAACLLLLGTACEGGVDEGVDEGGEVEEENDD